MFKTWKCFVTIRKVKFKLNKLFWTTSYSCLFQQGIDYIWRLGIYNAQLFKLLLITSSIMHSSQDALCTYNVIICICYIISFNGSKQPYQDEAGEGRRMIAEKKKGVVK